MGQKNVHRGFSDPNLFVAQVIVVYSQTCVKRPLMDKTKFLMTNGSLMKVDRIAECTPWSIL